MSGTRRNTDFTSHSPRESALRRWTKFVAGLVLLSGFTAVLMSGATPPGVCGEVLRHNQREHIDASPIFYSEVDSIWSMIRAIETRRVGQPDKSQTIDD